MTFQVEVSLYDLINPVQLDITIDESELEGLEGFEREEQIESILKEVVVENLVIHWTEKKVPVSR